MKKTISNYINQGVTENSRLLRFITVTLSAVLVCSIVLYWVYYFLIKMDGFTLHPKTVFDFINNAFFDISAFIYYHILHNYLLVALTFFLAIIYQGFKLYEHEDVRKINEKRGAVGLTLTIFSIVSLFFGIGSVLDDEYTSSFYGFLTFTISAFVIYVWILSLSFIDINEIGDFIKYLKNVYMKKTASKFSLIIYIVSLVFALYEPAILTTSFIILVFTGINMVIILVDHSIEGFQKDRLNKMTLRGYSIPDSEENKHKFKLIYALSLEECKKGNKLLVISTKEGKYNVDINTFAEKLEKVYTENNIDKEHLVFLCVKEYELLDKANKRGYIDFNIYVYNLDNEFLSEINIKSEADKKTNKILK